MLHSALTSLFFTGQLAEPLQSVVLAGLVGGGVLHVFQKWKIPDWAFRCLGWYCEFCLAFWLSGVFFVCLGAGLFVALALALASAMVAALALKLLYFQ